MSRAESMAASPDAIGAASEEARAPAAPGAALTCESLVIGHGGRALLPPIELSIERGRLLLIVGRNGAGKSTLVHTLLGLTPPVAGRVRRARPDLRLAYVPQAAALDDIVPVRAREVVEWGLVRGWSFLRPAGPRGRRDAVVGALRGVGAEPLRGQPFRELSGGQKQRVLFARLLAGDAEVVILDEPTASMDMTSETEAYERMAALAAAGLAVIVVTHTVGLAARHADTALLLDRSDRHEGGVVVAGPVAEVLSHPTSRMLFPGIAA